MAAFKRTFRRRVLAAGVLPVPDAVEPRNALLRAVLAIGTRVDLVVVAVRAVVAVALVSPLVMVVVGAVVAVVALLRGWGWECQVVLQRVVADLRTMRGGVRMSSTGVTPPA